MCSGWDSEYALHHASLCGGRSNALRQGDSLHMVFAGMKSPVMDGSKAFCPAF